MLSGNNFITRDTSNHNQHHQSPAAVSISQPLGSFDLSNIQPKTPSLPQTEVVKMSLCTEREAAAAREFKSKIFFFNCLKHLMVGARAIWDIQKQKESRWHGIDLCWRGRECWRKMMTFLMGWVDLDDSIMKFYRAHYVGFVCLS